jgi:hypothetical protein
MARLFGALAGASGGRAPAPMEPEDILGTPAKPLDELPEVDSATAAALPRDKGIDVEANGDLQEIWKAAASEIEHLRV